MDQELVAPNCEVPRCAYVFEMVLRQRYRKIIRAEFSPVSFEGKEIPLWDG